MRYEDMWDMYRRGQAPEMIPPPPVDPPSYDLALIDLPKLEPQEKPKNERSTRSLEIRVRLASCWCRVRGDDHGERVRKAVDAIIERFRSSPHE